MDNEVKIQFKNSVTGETKLEKYKQTLTQIYSLLNSIDTNKAQSIQFYTKNAKQVANDVKSISDKTSLAFGIKSIEAFKNKLKNLSQTMGKYIDQSSKYYENLNLLQVAFRGDTTEADKFVNKLSEMYGLDESWGYRTVGIFKQLSNAMGLANDIGTKLSKTMTQFAIDVSSLYNIETNDAVSILTSALAGFILVWLA